ncbi:Ig domain-containing protein group 1 domain-containing protein [Halobacteriales archaeon QH_2_65_14]|nr:MAG: Ig domain-containing protein group 1 domain-containing protein [Halobacteriales archaeon QH_2_65_14]
MSVTDLRRDERAIEGLPIRLVIALVVGVACLAVMMNVLGGLDTFGMTELDAQPEPEIIEPGHSDVNVTVLDSDGQPISNATVVAKSATAQLSGIATGETGPDGTTTLSLDPTLGPNQKEGTVALDIRPPEGDYTDDRENTDILVIEP